MSTDLAADAGSAYHRFRLKAQTLGTISLSFQTLTLGMTAAYYAALSRPAPEAWTTLVTQTASLVQRTKELHPVLVLDSKERDALDFFEAIVAENADLLASPRAGECWNVEPLTHAFENADLLASPRAGECWNVEPLTHAFV